ncbi:MAG TPA: TAXI family TRAP transporter solute-binding subunit [Pseudolabrys sp.]|nr:TAXI family TRAP transporter solute-binding subunit [Pseudolabrys sp.]
MRTHWLVRVSAAVILAAGTVAAHAEERITIGTGGTGGLFYVIGAGVAQVINKHMKDATARAEVTGASIENIRRVSAGQETMGFSSSSTLYEAKNGLKPFKQKQPVAAIAYLYPAVLQLAVLADSKYKSIADLKGATISIGPPGSNSAVLAQRLLTAYGVFDKNHVRFLSYTEGAKALENGTVDATCVLAGAPTAALIDLSTQRNTRFLSLDPSKVQGMMKKYKFYQIAEIPAGTYKGQDKPVKVINDPAILFTSAKAPKQLVYNITKAIFSNLDDIHAIHKQAKHIKLSTAEKTPIAIHPGALEYYQQVKKD